MPQADVDVLREMMERSSTARHRVSEVIEGLKGSVYPATIAQLARMEDVRRHVIDRYGVFTSADIAALRGAKRGDRSVASRYAAEKGLLHLTRGRSHVYPAFQFAKDGVHPRWADLVVPLQEAGWDDEDILLWMAAPHPGLDGREPAEVFERDPDRVVSLARIWAQGTA